MVASPVVATPGFRNAGIPLELAQEVEDTIRMYPWLGFRTLSSFAADSTRRRIDEVHRLAELRERMRQRAIDSGVELSDASLTGLAEAELADET